MIQTDMFILNQNYGVNVSKASPCFKDIISGINGEISFAEQRTGQFQFETKESSCSVLSPKNPNQMDVIVEEGNLFCKDAAQIDEIPEEQVTIIAEEDSFYKG